MQPDPDTLFFLISTGRCGSTLLQAMLSSHPRLYIPPELRYFGRHDPAKAFTDPLSDSDVENYLARCRCDPWWPDMGLDRAAFEHAVRHQVRSSRDIYLWVMGHIAEKRGNRKPRLGEKTTYYALFGDRIGELFPKAKFIHLYRDPRDVAASYLDQYWVSGGTALRCANHINRVWRRAARLADKLGPEQFHSIKYEALVENPERELSRLCAFLGEKYDSTMLSYTERQESGYLEVEREWKGMTQEELTASRIGRYATRMTPRQIWVVEHKLGPLLTEHGYDPQSQKKAPISWRSGFWAERMYQAALRYVGIRRALVDERAVLARRNELLKQPSRTSTGA